MILSQPEFLPNYGSASAKLPAVAVGPGFVELTVLKQEQVFFLKRKNILELEIPRSRQQAGFLAYYIGGLGPRIPFSVSWCLCLTGLPWCFECALYNELVVAVKSIGIVYVVLLKMIVVQLTTLKKEFVMSDDAKDIQGVDGFWPPFFTLDSVRSIPKFINSPLIDRLPQ